MNSPVANSVLCLYFILRNPIAKATIMPIAEEAVLICPDIPTGVLNVLPMSMSSKPVTRVGRAVIALEMTKEGMVSLDMGFPCVLSSILSPK